ncbi:IS21-like element ISCbo2 family helper ATPase IstB [Clostridium cochlearium]|uniref:IstB domain-containing protein ATP-binding protein n=3 Tax=Clostridium cochlearium TaxID=1494 RepID=A0A2X2Y534_CLOCO|nr:IS21-like element ISCbo2 family helper ATPase IstB [Clostridium cochlearium]SQB33069.1 IstB domain-containing protein ATP-binding protein [Clostridium cochlearium]SQB33593.1 IstB domain-containing protein ATP-binding protein [Clostridium cochlearium]SQB34133.1 IstB domain-containing protein ATP-binding protein [Clostridium cochlearium]
MNSTYTQLIKHLEYLKLKQMINHLDEVIDFSTKNNLSFVDALIKLTAYEIDFKEANMIKSMVKVGAFPHKKEVKDFDFSFQPSINKEQILDFLTLRFLDTQENIVFLGPSGVGKTHLATSIGIAAAKRRYSTYFIKCHDLLQQLKRANLENRLDSRLKHFSKYKLLIIDELGYLPIDKEDSKLFFQLIDMRYEKKSTILTTNINFNAWDDIFYDPVIANAILDRILHHAHVVPINGKSYRLKDHFKDDDE